VAIMSAHPSVRQAYDDQQTPFAAFLLLPKPIDLSRLLAIVAGAAPLPTTASDT
jgi:DNA-binding NtrC family response regulator